MLEYKVTVDMSMKGDNKPEAIEKKINEMVGQGWELAHITSFATTNVSRVYCVFSKPKKGPDMPLPSDPFAIEGASRK